MIIEGPPIGGSDLPVPLNQRYFEDYAPGSVCEYGTVRLEEADVIAFAKQYDPQDIHMNPELASHGPFGGLICSGWQSLGVMMRLYYEHYISEAAFLDFLGVDELRWLRPVRPGDSLTVRIRLMEATRSPSMPGQGRLRNFVELLNQDRKVVMKLQAISVVRCRQATRD